MKWISEISLGGAQKTRRFGIFEKFVLLMVEE
jgi:hypothetical protein